MTVTFHSPESVHDCQIKYAVIVAKYLDRWVFCRHKARKTWEIPGGHREAGESPDDTAHRELREETGAQCANITAVCAYHFSDYGMLYYAEITELGQLPDESEIGEICLCDTLPDQLTYPQIQPFLFQKVQNWLNNKST